jgi:hypothetical protein
VQGTVYRADGKPASGTLLVSWPAFTTPQNQAVAAGTVNSSIGADGFVSLNLTPNASALPTGSYYTAVYHLSDGSVNQEYWVVPASANASIATVRAQLEPSTVAVQPLSKAYLDSAISSLNGSWLSLAGGTMTGPLNLNTDPAAGNQAATKHYADQLAQAQLPLSGGTVTGPLNARQFEGGLYADQWQTGSSTNNGIAMSLAQCASLPYACQVLAPATYAVVEAQPWGGASWAAVPYQYSGPSSSSSIGCTSDQRWSWQIICNSFSNYPDNRHGIGPSITLNSFQPLSGAGGQNAAALTVQKRLWYGSYSYNSNQQTNNGIIVYNQQWAPASTNNVNGYLQNQSNGDSINFYGWDVQRGGIDSGDNEGGEERFAHMEAPDVWQGTINSITTLPQAIVPVTAYSLASNVLTLTAANTLTAGQTVTLSGFSTSTWLNNVNLVVSSTGLSGRQFQALFQSTGWPYPTTASATESGQAAVSLPCTGPCSVINAKNINGHGYTGGMGDELPIIDVSRSYSSGYIQKIAANVVTATSNAAWDAQFGLSNAVSTLTAAITNSTPATLTNYAVSVANASGFVTGQPACIFDTSGVNWQCSMVTAVNAGANTVTLATVKQSANSGATIAQGGMTGMGFRMNIDCVGPGSMQGMTSVDGGPQNNICPTFPIMYNTAGNAAAIVAGVRGGFSQYGTRGASAMGSGGTVTATVSGGVVTSCSASGGAGYSAGVDVNGYQTNPPTLTYQVNVGGTAPMLALLGNYSGLAGGGGCRVVNPGANLTSVAVAVTPSNPYTVFPMARAVNVWNPTTGAVDGSSIAVEPGGAVSQFQTGDTVEQEHHYAIQLNGILEHNYTYSGGVANGYISSIGGAFGGNDYGAWMQNTNQPTLYGNYPAGATPWIAGQGNWQTPYGYTLSGSWRNGFWMKMPPYSSTTLTGALVVGCFDYVNNVNICTKWTQPYNMLLAENANSSGLGEDALQYSIPSTTWSLTAGATGSGGSNAYCNETLAGNANGGFSVTCNGQTSKLDTSGNLSLPGAVRAQGGVTGATINGEITVDGTTYTTLNAAWSAAVGHANTSGQNQTIRLGPGSFSVTATLTEPANGACVSLIGSAAPTVTADSTNASTMITVPSSLGGDLFSLQNTAGSQAQSCTFRDLMILANKNANHAFNFQWFRGLYVDDLTVNDTIQDAFYLGETGGSHQANLEMRNVTVSYSASSFTPANRPNYGLNLQNTVLDSFIQNLLVRNALQAAVYNAGGGTTFELIHGFGYPYTCTTAPCKNTETNSGAADASWATNYEVVDTGSGGNMYFNTYMDSPAIAAFDLKTNGVQVNGGHIQWPDTTSFPNATFAEVESTVSSNLVISNVDCLNMSNTAGIPGSPAGATGVWISYMGANGSTPSYSSVSNLAGCGQYVQQRVAARQTAFDMAGNNSSNANYGSGQTGMTPKVYVTPLSSQANEGGVEVENFSGGQGDSFFSGFSGQASNFAVMADGTVRHTGLQTSAVFATSSMTLTKANHIVLANATTGALALTLPSCYTAMPDGLTPTGMEVTIVKTDSTGNAVQLTTTSSETISVLGSKAASYSLTSVGGVTLACGPDSNWYSTEQIGGPANSLAATPSQCPAGSYATGIAANGSANCAQAWRSTWYGYLGGTFGTSTNSSLGAIWSPSAAVSMTRLDIAVGTAPAGCSTWPVVGIYDGTASAWLKTVTLAAGTYSYRNAVSGVAITAGHNLSMGVQAAGVGCTTNPAAGQLTMEYTMNQ